MLTYKAMHKHLDDGVHGEVLDFPGTTTRRELADALVDMAETSLSRGEALPIPDPSVTDPESDLEEPIHLLLAASSRVRQVAQDPSP